MKSSNHIEKIAFHIAGIPCLIGVIEFKCVKGNSRANSDWDFHGYTDIDFEILDRKGYKAAWLEKKLNQNILDSIEEKILNHLES